MWTKTFICKCGYIYRASFELHSLMAIHIETGEIFIAPLFSLSPDEYEYSYRIYQRVLKKERKYYNDNPA